MGILISSIFYDIPKYEEILYDIVYNNFFFYCLIDELFSDLEPIKNSCREKVKNHLGHDLPDNLWDDVWDHVLIRIRCDEDNRFLFFKKIDLLVCRSHKKI